jgi:hypothetical protein
VTTSTDEDRERTVWHVLQHESVEPSHLGMCEKCGRTNVVAPGAGPITGTVGAEILALEDMHPSNVERLHASVRALVVARGGATVHLAQVASERGIAVALVENAHLLYPEGTLLTLVCDDATITAH